jgi:flagellar biosynthesis/type III secretory pathway M-ring protein FliF/YscJ
VTELIAFVVLVAFVAVVGIGLGMLVAPRLTRWTERDERDEPDETDDSEPDEEPRDDGPG